MFNFRKGLLSGLFKFDFFLLNGLTLSIESLCRLDYLIVVVFFDASDLRSDNLFLRSDFNFEFFLDGVGFAAQFVNVVLGCLGYELHTSMESVKILFERKCRFSSSCDINEMVDSSMVGESN